MRRARLTRPQAVTTIALLAAVVALGVPASAHVVIQGDPGFVGQVEDCLDKIAASGGQAGANLTQLTNSSNIHSITKGSGVGGTGCTANNHTNESNGKGTGSTTSWDPNLSGKYNGDTTDIDPCAALAHELSHAADADKGIDDDSPGANGIPKDEIKACGVENEYRANQSLPKRNKYGGKDLP